MVLVVGQAGVIDPADLRVLLQELGNLQRVVADAVHAQSQRFDALQNQERVEGRNRRAHVAQRHDAGTADVGSGAECFGIDDAVVGHVRFVETLELRLVLGPRELAAIDDDAADGIAMAAEVLGQGMDDDVGAVLERAAQVRRGHGVVDDDRHAMLVGDLGELFEVGDVAERVADRFAEHRLGLAVDQFFEGCRVTVIGKAHLDAILRQGVGEQVVGAAVQGAGRDDVVAGFGNRLDRGGDRRHARGHGQRRNAAFHRGDALFQHVGGRVHDAGVDVAGDLEIEQVGAVLGAVEGVGSGLVNGHGNRFGRRVGTVAAVYGKRFKFHDGVSVE